MRKTLTLRVRTRAVGEKEQVEVRALLANAAGADAGLHPLAGRRGVRASVARIRTALGAATPAALDGAADHTGDSAWLAKAVDAVLATKADAEAKFVALAHLLGLTCDLRVKGARGAKAKGGSTGAVDVEVTARILRPIAGLEVAAELKLPEGWNRTDKAAWRAAKLRAGAVAKFIAGVKAPATESRTSTLRAELEFRVGGRALRVALDRTVMPSINCWHIVGPFDNPGGHELDLAFAPEKKVDLKASYVGKDGKKIRWQKAVRTLADVKSLDSEFFIELNDFYGRSIENAVAYAFAWVHSPRAMDAVLAMGSDDGVRGLGEREGSAPQPRGPRVQLETGSRADQAEEGCERAAVEDQPGGLYLELRGAHRIDVGRIAAGGVCNTRQGVGEGRQGLRGSGDPKDE
jgi:hypothetical protein